MSINGAIIFSVLLAMVVVRGLRRFLDLPTRLPRLNALLDYIWVPGVVLYGVAWAVGSKSDLLDETYLLLFLGALVVMLLRLRHYRPARTILLAVAPFFLYSAIELGLASLNQPLLKQYDDFFDTSQGFALIWLFTFLFIARGQKKQLEKESLIWEEEEKAKRRIEAQNAELEHLVAERTATLTQQTEELRYALTELRATQAQLIQSEKMASLGELTAGIAHEIQNPLNFVTNFSDVSTELLDELAEEQSKPDHDPALAAEILADLKQNLQKITHHGQRAASIVRAMLEHSRTNNGERQPTNLNKLADEYLRLAYHGLRAKDKSFNATITTFFDPSLPSISAVSQDLGRVLLNLFTNAFYAVQKKQKQQLPGYVPTISVSTLCKPSGTVEIRVHDNGTGIPEAIRQKIFQPFFTTKPTGEGTGLGLSLSYDIVTKSHGGTLAVATQEGESTEFIVTLPIEKA